MSRARLATLAHSDLDAEDHFISSLRPTSPWRLASASTREAPLLRVEQRAVLAREIVDERRVDVDALDRRAAGAKVARDGDGERARERGDVALLLALGDGEAPCPIDSSPKRWVVFERAIACVVYTASTSSGGTCGTAEEGRCGQSRGAARGRAR